MAGNALTLVPGLTVPQLQFARLQTMCHAVDVQREQMVIHMLNVFPTNVALTMIAIQRYHVEIENVSTHVTVLPMPSVSPPTIKAFVGAFLTTLGHHTIQGKVAIPVSYYYAN